MHLLSAGTTRGQRAQAQLQDEGHMNELLRQIDLRMDEILEALYMQLSKDIDAAVDQKLETAAASSSKWHVIEVVSVENQGAILQR